MVVVVFGVLRSCVFHLKIAQGGREISQSHWATPARTPLPKQKLQKCSILRTAKCKANNITTSHHHTTLLTAQKGTYIPVRKFDIVSVQLPNVVGWREDAQQWFSDREDNC